MGCSQKTGWTHLLSNWEPPRINGSHHELSRGPGPVRGPFVGFRRPVSTYPGLTGEIVRWDFKGDFLGLNLKFVGLALSAKPN